MSSGFIPAGTAPPEVTAEDAAWTAARAVVAGAAKPKETENKDERSLFEILQSNKAKKQEEFEEKLKFKNQFKALDEDDVEYLDSVMDAQKRVDMLRRREVESQLDEFRTKQSDVDKPEELPEADVGGWKKRKRKDNAVGAKAALGLKVRKTSDATKPEEKKEDEALVRAPEAQKTAVKAEGVQKRVEKEMKPVAKPAPKPAGLGLVDYDSDSEDD